jgi:hypothetical protein
MWWFEAMGSQRAKQRKKMHNQNVQPVFAAALSQSDNISFTSGATNIQQLTVNRKDGQLITLAGSVP